MTNIETCKIMTKPSLVDFLRLCDRNHWCTPRIRYASIRSKPELIQDLVKFFHFENCDDYIRITPFRSIHGFPDLKYHIRSRKFHRDGKPYDCAAKSRAKPTFQLEKKKVTLHFGKLYRAQHGNGTAAVSSGGSLGPVMSTLGGC